LLSFALIALLATAPIVWWWFYSPLVVKNIEIYYIFLSPFFK
jgi:hypothetical protein